MNGVNKIEPDEILPPGSSQFSPGGSPSASTALTTGNAAVLQIVDLVINGLNSPHSKRIYSTALFEFLEWFEAQGKPGLSKATIQAFKQHLQGKKLAPSTINLKLCAVRKLIQEISDNGLIDPLMAANITKVKGIRSAGVRTGNWLSREEAQDLINAPDLSTLKGLRDRAILAVLIGCGLRRSEASRLSNHHIQQREGRWAMVDLVGKGSRVRTVPMPPWTKVCLDAWNEALKLEIGPYPASERIFRAINKSDKLAGVRKATGYLHSDGYMSDQAIADVVRFYADRLGFTNLAAHDLRRTFAKLARKGGAEIDQIQLSLGHASIQTTERYLGTDQDLADAPADRLGIELKRQPAPLRRPRKKPAK